VIVSTYYRWTRRYATHTLNPLGVVDDATTPPPG